MKELVIVLIIGLVVGYEWGKPRHLFFRERLLGTMWDSFLILLCIGFVVASIVKICRGMVWLGNIMPLWLYCVVAATLITFAWSLVVSRENQMSSRLKESILDGLTVGSIGLVAWGIYTFVATHPNFLW